MKKTLSILALFFLMAAFFMAGCVLGEKRVRADIAVAKFMDNTIILAYIKNKNFDAASGLLKVSSDALIIEIAENQKNPIVREDENVIKKWADRYYLIRQEVPPVSGDVVDESFEKKVLESFLMIINTGI